MLLQLVFAAALSPQPRSLPTWCDSARITPAVVAAVAVNDLRRRAWYREEVESVLKEATAGHHDLPPRRDSARLADTLDALHSRDPSGLLQSLVDVGATRNVSVPLLLALAAREYRRLSGAAAPALLAAISRDYYASRAQALAMTVGPFNDAERVVIRRFACDAAWLLLSADADSTYRASVLGMRPWYFDEAARLLDLVRGFRDPVLRSELRELISDRTLERFL